MTQQRDGLTVSPNVDVDGSQVVELSSVGEGWQVDWSPDCRSFASSRGLPPDDYDTYVMHSDGSEVERLVEGRCPRRARAGLLGV